MSKGANLEERYAFLPGARGWSTLELSLQTWERAVEQAAPGLVLLANAASQESDWAKAALEPLGSVVASL